MKGQVTIFTTREENFTRATIKKPGSGLCFYFSSFFKLKKIIKLFRKAVSFHNC